MRLSCFTHKAYIIQRPQYNGAFTQCQIDKKAELYNTVLILKIINIYNEKPRQYLLLKIRLHLCLRRHLYGARLKLTMRIYNRAFNKPAVIG